MMRAPGVEKLWAKVKRFEPWIEIGLYEYITHMTWVIYKPNCGCAL